MGIGFSATSVEVVVGVVGGSVRVGVEVIVTAEAGDGSRGEGAIQRIREVLLGGDRHQKLIRIHNRT